MKYKEYLEKYKSQAIFLCVIIAAIFTVLWVIIPQFQSISGVRQDIADVQKKLTNTQKSVQTLSGQNREAIDSNFKLVTTALPPGKDVTNIYTALVGTASKTGVIFEGFTVQLGDVYSKKKTSPIISTSTGSPTINVSAKFGNVTQKTFSSFARALAVAFPLSEITKILIVDGSGEVQINFFYKPYNLAVIGKTDVVTAINAQEQALLTKLAGWQSQ